MEGYKLYMLESKGDLWDSKYDTYYRCITTNGILNSKGELIMGAGIALQAKQKYPDLSSRLGKLVKESGNHPYIFPEYKIISFPTKNHWKDKSHIGLIIRSCNELVIIANDENIKSIILPQPGCGNGGLLWSEVKPIISKILDDRFTVLI